MAMYTAFFDASGNHESPAAMFVAGLVASADEWLAFEREWLALLSANGMESPFHMTDFKAGAPPYGEWLRDIPKQHKFEREAVKIIVKHARHSFAQGFVIPDFDRMHATYAF